MGWIGDTFKALLGFDDEERAFRDTLASAERHVQWGATEPDERDLELALKLLSECPPEDAPNAHYVYRRERASAEAHTCLARLAAEALRIHAQKIEEHFGSVEESHRALVTQAASLRVKVEALEAEGSLISAREERRRLEEMERETHNLPELDTEKQARRAETFSACAPRFAKHREGAAGSLAALRALRGLAAEDRELCDKIVAHIENTLSATEKQWKPLAADFEKDAKDAAKNAEKDAKNAEKPAG